METKFSLYLAILKNVLMSLLFLLSNGEVKVSSAATVEHVAPAVASNATKDGKPVESNIPVVDATKKAEEKKTAPTDAAVVVDPTKKTAVAIDSKTVAPATAVDATKKAEDKAVAGTHVPAVDATKKIEDKTAAPTDTNAVVDATKKVEDKTAAGTYVPVIDAAKKTTAPTDAAVVVDATKKVEDKTAAPTGTNVAADVAKKPAVATTEKTTTAIVETKKDASAPVPGSQEALKAELLAELKEVVKKQVDETVSAKMVNSNAPIAATSNAHADAKSTAAGDKDGKGEVVHKGVDLAGVHKTTCNMFTATTCGENSACVLHDTFCRTNCPVIGDQGACAAASDCEWGTFRGSCDFKK